MPLQIIKGDIFTSKADYLVCPVNCEGIMDKGLAKEFKKRFPEIEAPYKDFCTHSYLPEDGENCIPPILYDIGDCEFYDNKLFFATKKNWQNKSDLLLIKSGLIKLKGRTLIEALGFSFGFEAFSYAFPALGCGEGSLNWLDIKAIFEEVFQDCENLIELYEPIS